MKKESILYHGLDVSCPDVETFRRLEQSLFKSIDEGDFVAAHDRLLEIKDFAGESETNRLVFEEIRKEAASYRKKRQQRIVAKNPIIEAAVAFSDARLIWHLSFGMERPSDSSFTAEELLAESVRFGDRLRILKELGDSEFNELFSQLSLTAQEAWIDCNNAERKLGNELQKFVSWP